MSPSQRLVSIAGLCWDIGHTAVELPGITGKEVHTPAAQMGAM